MEKILKIEEITEGEEYLDGKSGYAITTDKQVVKLLIDNYQSCCESWGYFMTEDNVDEFIGADLIDISLTDTALNTKKLEEHNLDPNDKWVKTGIMFVNLNTSKGLLQFVAYNVHNGYYGHEAYVYSEQLNHSEWL